MVLVAVIAFVALLCGFISAAVASSKGLSAGAYFVVGLLLGVIGIIIAAVASRAAPAPQPPGWYADPWGQALYRYYDGAQWTYHMSNGEAVAS